MTNGSWHSASRHHLGQLVRFLQQKEWGCVSLSARLYRRGRLGLPLSNQERLTLCYDATGRINGILFYTTTGLYMPVFRDASPEQIECWAAGVKPDTNNVQSIVGQATAVETLSRRIARLPRITQDYWLMTKEDCTTVEPSAEPPDKRLQIRQATERDALSLLPLQQAYLREEVLQPDEPERDPRLTLSLLRKDIHNQMLYVALWCGQIVSKAGTNARGMNFDQIGGVYTTEKFRTRGVARRLMSRLIGEIGREDRRACLFVKQHNRVALRLYQNLGFHSHDTLRIQYY